jgi:hypothetical protein
LKKLIFLRLHHQPATSQQVVVRVPLPPVLLNQWATSVNNNNNTINNIGGGGQ